MAIFQKFYKGSEKLPLFNLFGIIIFILNFNFLKLIQGFSVFIESILKSE